MSAPTIIGWVGGMGPAWSDGIGADSRETAFARLDDVDAYYSTIDDDYVRAISGKSPKLDIKNNKTNRGIYDAWRAQFTRWREWSQATRAAGISRVDTGDVDAQCVRFTNDGRTYRARLAEAIGGGNVSTPDIPEAKPLPGLLGEVKQGLQEGADKLAFIGYAALAAVAVGTVVALRKLPGLL